MSRLVLLLASLTLLYVHPSRADDSTEKTDKTTLQVLFIGNSYTARHNLANVVKAMAEEQDPGLSFMPTTVIYGGRTLADHWQLGTQNIVRVHELTQEEQNATVARLTKLADDPTQKYAGAALKRHRALLSDLEESRTKWDVVVLQSYRDDLTEDNWLYSQYAPKFAAIAKQQGAKVVLYETTPTTQNAEPLNSPPAPDAVLKKAKTLATLADKIQASAAPMSLVGLHCQTERPDLTLRFVNDAHLNQTMAYLTACTIYSAIFDRSPQGISVDSITDIRFWKNKDRTKDRDAKPITRMFSEQDRTDLQKISWTAFRRFQELRAEK